MGCHQVVKVGNNISTSQHWGPTMLCVQPSPVLLVTHDCVAMQASNSIIKFADNTTVKGLNTNDDETAYR